MAVKPIPDGYNRVQPYLLVRDVPKQIEFLTKPLEDGKSCVRPAPAALTPKCA
jgi:hypothetical protein